MTTHSHPPDIGVNGLADNCERCAEHAEHPIDSLDDGNLERLIDRIADGGISRSYNEGKAMQVLVRIMVPAAKLLKRGWSPK